MAIRLPKLLFILIVGLGLISSGLAQSKGSRFNGIWTVSRGGGGMGRIFVDNKTIKGVIMDSGWLQMTGERRVGQLKGSLDGENTKLTIEWSSGPTVEFRGEGSLNKQGLSLNLIQFTGSKAVKDTQFTWSGHPSGQALSEPFGKMTRFNLDELWGEWTGSYVYGPNKGMAFVTIKQDGSCEVAMANERPNDDTWSALGFFKKGEDTMNLTVNSGFSKQTYHGVVKSLSIDQVEITFDRENGKFVMYLTRW